MTNSDLLRESIDRATGAPVAPPDIDALKRRGRRRSVVRTAGAALATLGVVAAGTVVVRGLDDAQQVPASIQGQGPAAAYISRPAQFHVDGHTYRPAHIGHLSDRNSAVTSAGLVYIDRDGVPRLLDRDGGERKLGPAIDPGGRADWNTPLVHDPSGRYATWFAFDGDRVVLNRFDSRAGRVTERTPLDSGIGEPDGTMQFIDDGVTYFSSWSPERTLAWAPDGNGDGNVYPVTDAGTTITAVAGKTMLVRGDGEVYDASGRPVDGSWTIVRLGSTHIGEDTEKLLSSDGDWAIRNVPGHPGLSALNTHTGEVVALDNSAGEIMSVRMDNDGSVLTISSPSGNEGHFDDGRLRDCDPATGECALLGTLGGVWPDFPIDSDF